MKGNVLIHKIKNTHGAISARPLLVDPIIKKEHITIIFLERIKPFNLLNTYKINRIITGTPIIIPKFNIITIYEFSIPPCANFSIIGT